MENNKEKETVENKTVSSKARSYISYVACKLKGHDLTNTNYCRTCRKQH